MAEFFANVEVDGFVSKPCAPSDLLMEVGRILFLRGSRQPESRDSGAVHVGRVLVGDGDEHACKALMDAFIEAGFIVDGVLAGPQILEKAIVGKPDVVLMKVILPGMNGDVVAKMMKEMPTTKDIPIVLYDDEESNVQESRYTQSGIGVRKLVKSNNPGMLVDVVKEALRGQE